MESISVPDLNDSKKCHRAADSGAVASGDVKIESLDKKPAYMLKYVGRAINETADETAKPPNPPASETAHNSSPPSTHPHESTTHKKAAAPGVIDISKNLMLTSVSVLALNHLIN